MKDDDASSKKSLFLMLVLGNLPAYFALKNLIILASFPSSFWGKATTAYIYYPLSILIFFGFMWLCYLLARLWVRGTKTVRFVFGLMLALASAASFLISFLLLGTTTTRPIYPSDCKSRNLVRVDVCFLDAPEFAWMDTPYREITYGKPTYPLCQKLISENKAKCPEFLRDALYACMKTTGDQYSKEESIFVSRNCEKAIIFTSRSYGDTAYTHDIDYFKTDFLNFFESKE